MMRTRTWLRLPRSLKLTLLWLLLPGLVGVLAIDIVSAYQALRGATDRAYDRALLGSVRAIENGVTIERGQVQVNVPYVALSMFESTAQSNVYYRVAFESPPGKPPEAALTGYEDLPLPKSGLENDTPLFYDATYHGEPVRVAAVAKPLYQPGLPARIVIQVAETIETRRALQQAVWRGTLLRDAALVAVSAALLWLGVTVALRPLNRLARSIAVRASDDLRPLDTTDVPAEVRPLVNAINHHIHRYAELAEAQSQFLADASHQLRTPLAVLLTQAEYALRETDPTRVRESLSAIIARLQSTNRLTTQLLALARARHAGQDAPAETFDLGELARDVVVDALPLAREKQQDLGWDEGGAAVPLPVIGYPAFLREALSNLVHNALRYTPAGGRITVRAMADGDHALVCVDDTGPGMTPDERAHAFQRFRRAHEGGHRAGQPKDTRYAAEGSGLGLAIARAYAARSGGHIELADGEPNRHGGVGLSARIRVPLAASAAPSEHAATQQPQ
ncbi:sensor histidine kinase [Ralstonia mannitolilytica]|uniref:histidine kinase n=1 Tax=Ralstonia mannitolilytica TaxID=105219 RepID=A0AAJ4ZRE4_9RALS|nr:sensor histidine kinase [Ralstonia mannitolilytica]CAG2148832.1 Adaptive-response sensory-kinase SasA [Ralstonia mannitolilytica]CAJ0728007.1 Adaptive-response sensory-kinase SasA [Ralstonia mannitolilytica]SUD88973.1 Swarming motility regulation sensor protein rssA [Ralstonia mannitolilytica]SUD94933.1 Swarming motility regulation sensor protein rssA [Ralstonia mannitolilytica]SUE42297.1 Swarming motility regulation sensor protein rssA [Ralstonia mannitolilytica]